MLYKGNKSMSVYLVLIKKMSIFYHTLINGNNTIAQFCMNNFVSFHDVFQKIPYLPHAYYLG